MSIATFFRDVRQHNKDAQQITKLQIQLTQAKVKAAQMASDILVAREDSKKYKSNYYPSYDMAIQEINNKYKATADWGIVQTGNIIDLRAAFTIAEGINIKTKVKGQGRDELKFAQDFLEYNDLDKEVIQEFAKEAEIEGKILLRLFWEEADKMVSTRYVSWLSKKYKANPNPQDYLDIQTVTWKDEEGKEIKLEPAEFIYKKFGGRVNEPNEAAPKIMKCLSKIDDLDKALRDLREIDRIFAGPLLWFKFENAADAQKGQVVLDQINWKIKKGICTNAEINYTQPTMEGVDSLIKEILTLAKIISGATGVPVHFLGFPELLSNRATADNFLELIFAATLKERQTWKGCYQEVLAKAMAIFNAKTGLEQMSKKLDPSRITIDIPYISAQTWQNLKDVFLPAALAGKISDELFLSKIPGVDVDEELKRTEADNAFTKKGGAVIPFTPKENAAADQDQAAAEAAGIAR
jgi:hypothetical protein